MTGKSIQITIVFGILAISAAPIVQASACIVRLHAAPITTPAKLFKTMSLYLRKRGALQGL